MNQEMSKEKLPQIFEGYNADDIWNIDETGCFWRALPGKELGQMKKESKSGKKSEERVTIAFVVNISESPATLN